MAEEVTNRQIILKYYVTGSLSESDMELKSINMSLKLPDSCSHGVLVKNLYLSIDPYARGRMGKPTVSGYLHPCKPGLPVTAYAVARVVDSRDPRFKKGDLVWGWLGWEEYSLVTFIEGLFRIEHTDVPLSYYAGILDYNHLYDKYLDVVSPLIREGKITYVEDIIQDIIDGLENAPAALVGLFSGLNIGKQVVVVAWE